MARVQPNKNQEVGMKHIKLFEEYVNDQSGVKANISQGVIDGLTKMATGVEYDAFLDKTDGSYELLYHGGGGSELRDRMFFTDWIEHARAYGDTVVGIITDGDDYLRMNNNEWEHLRIYFGDATIPELKVIYKRELDGHVLGNEEYDTEKKVLKFIHDFLRSETPYEDVQGMPWQNDLLVPIMLHYAETKKQKNIISFIGSDYDGSWEYVVNDVDRYPTLHDVWMTANPNKPNPLEA